MAGAGLKYNLDAIQVLRDRIGALGHLDRRRLLDTIGATVESQTRRRITDVKESPSGEAWPQWSDKYAATRHGGHSMLEGEGLLLASMGFVVSLAGDFVEVGSNLIYGATQQFGDPERKIPARAYLGLSSEDESDLGEVIDNFLARVAP